MASSSDSGAIRGGDLGVGVEIGAEVAAAGLAESGPGGHRTALDDGVGVLARDAGAGEHEQDLAAEWTTPPRAVEVGLHLLGVDGELVHHAGEAVAARSRG